MNHFSEVRYDVKNETQVIRRGQSFKRAESTESNRQMEMHIFPDETKTEERERISTAHVRRLNRNRMRNQVRETGSAVQGFVDWISA